MHGVRGGLVAGLLFILPGALVMLALSAIYVAFGEVPLVAALFFGLKCAVLVLVVEALLRVARRALKGRIPWLLAGAAFAALFLFALPFPVVVAAAALIGFALPHAFAGGGHGRAQDGPPALLDALIAAEPGRIARMGVVARRAGLAALALWLWPVVLLMQAGGLYGDLAWFFSKMAVVTFGGAYAVLAYVAQEAVEGYRWLSADQMLAGLGLAETTPGPLILVLQFVGYLAGGTAGALLVLWVTFAPCFAWIFLGAPYIERLHDVARLKGALAGVTAAVVGVIANLALWFGLRVLFRVIREVPLGPMRLEVPVLASLDSLALLLAVLAGVALFRMRLGVVQTLALTAVAGLVLKPAADWLLSGFG
jgi:chromate transporter